MPNATKKRAGAPMRPYVAWQIVSASGVPWYDPRRTRGEAISEYVSRAMLPSGLTPAAAWAAEKRRYGFRCVCVYVKEWGVPDA